MDIKALSSDIVGFYVEQTRKLDEARKTIAEARKKRKAGVNHTGTNDAGGDDDDDADWLLLGGTARNHTYSKGFARTWGQQSLLDPYTWAAVFEENPLAFRASNGSKRARRSASISTWAWSPSNQWARNLRHLSSTRHLGQERAAIPNHIKNDMMDAVLEPTRKSKPKRTRSRKTLQPRKRFTKQRPRR